MFNRNEFKAQIARAGKTSKELAEFLGIDESTLYRWRHEPDSIPAGELRLLFKAVKLPPEKVIEFFK